MSEQVVSNKNTKKNIILALKITGNVLFYALLALVLLFSIGNIRAKNDPKKVPNVFGNGYLSVLSNSMEGNEKDSFNKGDLIIIDVLSDKEKENIKNGKESIKVGDIITFYDDNLEHVTSGASKMLNTHRVVYVAEHNNNGKIDYLYITMGDKARKEKDNFDYVKALSGKTEDEVYEILRQFQRMNGSNLYIGYELVTIDNIVGVHSSTLSGFGKTIEKVNENFFVVIVVPVIIFLLVELGFFGFNLMKLREEKLKAKLAVESPTKEEALSDEELKEKLKEELRQELLKELQASKPQEEEAPVKKEPVKKTTKKTTTSQKKKTTEK